MQILDCHRALTRLFFNDIVNPNKEKQWIFLTKTNKYDNIHDLFSKITASGLNSFKSQNILQEENYVLMNQIFKSNMHNPEKNFGNWKELFM